MMLSRGRRSSCHSTSLPTCMPPAARGQDPAHVLSTAQHGAPPPEGHHVQGACGALDLTKLGMAALTLTACTTPSCPPLVPSARRVHHPSPHNPSLLPSAACDHVLQPIVCPASLLSFPPPSPLTENLGREVGKYFYGAYAVEHDMPSHTHSSYAASIIEKLTIGKLKTVKNKPITESTLKSNDKQCYIV